MLASGLFLEVMGVCMLLPIVGRVGGGSGVERSRSCLLGGCFMQRGFGSSPPHFFRDRPPQPGSADRRSGSSDGDDIVHSEPTKAQSYSITGGRGKPFHGAIADQYVDSHDAPVSWNKRRSEM